MKTGRQLSTVDEDLDEQQKLTAELVAVKHLPARLFLAIFFDVR